jgi:hypothetical protein
MNEQLYKTYKLSKQLIEIAKNCCNKDHTEEELFKVWKTFIECIDEIDKGYDERYEKEKSSE